MCIRDRDTPTGGNPDPDNPDVDNPDIDTPDNPDIDNPDDNPTTDVTQTYRVNTQIKNGVGDISPSVTVNKGEDYTCLLYTSYRRSLGKSKRFRHSK